MSADPQDHSPAHPATSAAALRGRGRWMVANLAITNTISWGILYYSFAVFLPVTAVALGHSETAVSGALTVAMLMSAAAGIPAGRFLDHHPPRLLMTAGSVAAVLLVVAWSQVGGLLAFYAVWALIGLTMAAVLYEPSFVAITKAFPDPVLRRRGITAVTLVAALASFIFLPLAQALLDAEGRRTAILILAAILVVPVLLHALLPGGAGTVPAQARSAAGTSGVTATLRRPDFQLLTAGYVLVSLASWAPLVVAIPYLVSRGFSPGFSALAVGVIGAAQLPGRLLFGLATARLTQKQGVISTFILVAAGLALLVPASSAAVVLAGTVLLGVGRGMTTLSRATLLADRFGTADYGAVASVTAAATTGATAVSPLAATAIASATSVTTLLWVLVGSALAAVAAIAPLTNPQTG